MIFIGAEREIAIDSPLTLIGTREMAEAGAIGIDDTKTILIITVIRREKFETIGIEVILKCPKVIYKIERENLHENYNIKKF